MLAENEFRTASDAPSSPKSLEEVRICPNLNAFKAYLLNGPSSIDVPMNARSYPKRKAPIEVTIARI